VRRVARGIQRARAAGSDAATAAQRTTLTGLDIGAFNGWLSHNLLCDGVDITAVDLFDDDDFGLGARRHFHRRWRAVQADVCTPELFAGDFDLVVMNHGVHFLPDPTALLARWQHRVAPGGAMVVLGLRIYRDGRARRDEVDAIARRGSASGATLFPLAGPGLLDVDDARTLRRLGFALRPTAARWKGNLRAILQLSPMLRSTAPVHLRAVYRRPG
jgi:SAM-dependent methyltransferase